MQPDLLNDNKKLTTSLTSHTRTSSASRSCIMLNLPTTPISRLLQSLTGVRAGNTRMTQPRHLPRGTKISKLLGPSPYARLKTLKKLSGIFFGGEMTMDSKLSPCLDEDLTSLISLKTRSTCAQRALKFWATSTSTRFFTTAVTTEK